MVQGVGCRWLSDAQYKLDFCKDCSFYECELVGEYAQFRESHTQEYKEPNLLTTDDGRCAGTVIGVWGKEEYDELAVSSGFADAHSHSFDGDVLSYDQTKMKDVCIMKKSVYQVECGRKNVAEGIGDHYKVETDFEYEIEEGTKDRWQPSQPVFISAQTGQGKNYFVENILIPYVRELNLKHQTKQKVLILSNRRALETQIEKRIDGNYDSDKENEIYSYKEYADVMTYQSVLYCKKRLKEKQKYAESRYIFVICDEAHFFTSDAMFNPHTQKILQTIIQVFKDAVRVYMSATPYECLEYIIHHEWDYYMPKGKCEITVFYHFKRDYAYLDIKTYSSIDELYGEIVESITQKKEKWLVFIDDKEKCVREKNKLEELIKDKESSLVIEDKKSKKKDEEDDETDKDNEAEKKVKKVYVVDANSKKESIYQGIVKDEELDKDTYVLISTSVLDNGVNLKGIKNIVVSDMTKAKCLQMVGRARVEGDNDKKNLYIKRFSDDEVERRIKDLKNQQDAYGKYEIAYKNEQPNGCSKTYDFFMKYYNGSEADWRNAKRWFGRTIETELYLNKIAKLLLERHLIYYQAIRNEMIDEKLKEGKAQDSKCMSHVGQKYLEYQLSWFGKKYCEDDDITFADKEKKRKSS